MPLIISTLRSATRPCCASSRKSLHAILGRLRSHSTSVERKSLDCSTKFVGIVEVAIFHLPLQGRSNARYALKFTFRGRIKTIQARGTMGALHFLGTRILKDVCRCRLLAEIALVQFSMQDNFVDT